MDFSLLTYNTMFNKAYELIKPIVNQHRPDIICLQEVVTSDANLKILEKYGYKLADYSNSFIKFGRVYGVATFYNPSKFKFIGSDSLKMSINLSELLFTIPQLILGINKPKSRVFRKKS